MEAAADVQPTPEEIDVLGQLARGLTDEAVMRKLGLSRRTLERRLRSGMEKLQAHSRFQGGFHLALSGWVRDDDVHFPPAGGAGTDPSADERGGEILRTREGRSRKGGTS